MGAALEVEWLKLRRSRVFQVTTGLLVLGIPLLAALFMRAARGSSRSQLSVKIHALITGTGWSAYMALADQVVSVGLLLGFGIVAAWCFGREFTDRTWVSLFALPVTRRTIAGAKFVVLVAWSSSVCCLTTIVLFAVGPLAGMAAPGWGAAQGGARLFSVGLLTALLALPMALPASAGRGYLSAIGALLMLVIAAQLLVGFGVGAWFPYAAPGLWGQPAAAANVQPIQLVLVPLTALAGAWATLSWWRNAEVT